MITSADSSVIVQLHVPEAGHEQVRRLERPLLISGLATVEVAGALWRKQRLGEFGPADAALLVQAFTVGCADVGDAFPFAVVAVTPEILRHAARLVALHPLRADDAVQLASALVTHQALCEPLAFAAADRALNAAAAAAGLVLASID